MRIILLGDSPRVQSGYGVQIGHLAESMKADGHDVAILGRSEQEHGPITYSGIPVWPRTNHGYGYDTAVRRAKEWRADIVLGVHDTAVADPGALEREGIRWATYFPVDGEPVSPIIVNTARRAWARVTYTRRGVELMAEHGIEADYAPNVLDASVFTPAEDREEAKRGFWDGLEDPFMFGMVAANTEPAISRKAFPQVIQAFKRVAERHENAYLYLHTIDGPHPQRLHIQGLAHGCDLPPGRLIFPDADQMAAGEIGADVLARIYRALDCVLMPSMAEGFGVPAIEAQACGTPVIMGEWLPAGPEVVRHGELLQWEDSDPFWVPHFHAWHRIPHVGPLASAMERAYHRQLKGRASDPLAATEAIRAEYGHEAVYERHWKPILADWKARVEAEERTAA